MRIMSIFIVLVINGLWAVTEPSPLGAQKIKPPAELLKDKLNAVLAVLQNKELDTETKNKHILKIVLPVFDFDLMAKLALGRKHGKNMTKEQYHRYSYLFIERLKVTYSEKLADYSNQEIIFKPSIKEKKRIYVPMELMNGDDKISILFKFYFHKNKQRWIIYDVEIQGVSVIKTYQAQFDEILTNGSVDDLLEKLTISSNKKEANAA